MNKRHRAGHLEAFHSKDAFCNEFPRAKRAKLHHREADKENVPLSRVTQRENMSARHRSKKITNGRAAVKPKKNAPGTRKVLTVKKTKYDDTTELLAAHPVSKHILRSNLYDDETWKGKQQELFVGILNDILGSQKKTSMTWDGQAPEGIRSAAFEYYQADTFRDIAKRLNTAFKNKRLNIIRQPRCFRDIGLSSAVKELLYHSYTSAWLCLGLELVTGRICQPHSPDNKPFVYSFLENFVLGHVDTHDILDETSQDQVSVMNLFLLIYILDHLKERVSGPCLFRSDSKLKSSLSIAQRLSKLCLTGEGDVSRRLHSITKCQLVHNQYPLDDFDYRITNLAVDMRDGVRLTRLIEILSGRNDLLPQLRYPLLGVSGRIHNLSVALRAIQSEGVRLCMEDGRSVDATDIETGNREKTLFLLWGLISRWKLPQYLENISMKEEITSLRTILGIRKVKLPSIKIYRFLECSYMNDLLEWAALVCSLCRKPLENLTTSFINNEPFNSIFSYYFPRNHRNSGFHEYHQLPIVLGTSNAGRGNPRNLLDIRVIITTLALIASRVLLNNDRIEAAKSIQRAFRARFREKNHGSLERHSAATTIQRAYRRYQKRKTQAILRATIAVQALARGYLFRMKWRRKALSSALVGRHQAYRAEGR